MTRKLLINGYGGVSMTIVRLYQQKFAVSNLARPRSATGKISGYNVNGIMQIRRLERHLSDTHAMRKASSSQGTSAKYQTPSTAQQAHCATPHHLSSSSGGNIMAKAILRKKRTEEGKALRKQYESHSIGYTPDMRAYEPRTDHLSNTLTTITKDNLLISITHVPTQRQHKI